MAGDEVQGQATGGGVIGAGGVVAHHRARLGEDWTVRQDRRLTLGDREDLHMVVEAQGDEAVQIRAFQHDAAIGRRQILDQGDGQGAELQLVPHATRDAQEPGHARSTLSAASFSMAAMV